MSIPFQIANNMGKSSHIKVCSKGVQKERHDGSTIWTGKLTIENTSNIAVLYKVRASISAKANVMIKPNMGLLLQRSITEVIATFRDEDNVTLQVVSATYPAGCLNQQKLKPFNIQDTWAFVTDAMIDKDFIKFKMGANGEGSMTVVGDPSELTATAAQDRQKSSKMKVEPQDSESTAILQASIERISQLEQENATLEKSNDKANTCIYQLNQLIHAKNQPNNSMTGVDAASCYNQVSCSEWLALAFIVGIFMNVAFFICKYVFE
jgi:hypothetical protein